MSKYRNQDIRRYADIFKALSNPNRLKIYLKLLSCCSPGTIHSVDPETCAYIGELGKDLGIVASTVSHHIKELRQAGLIRLKRRGQKIECWIDPEVFDELKVFFSE
jgi:ArsR family transcriptional regulator